MGDRDDDGTTGPGGRAFGRHRRRRRRWSAGAGAGEEEDVEEGGKISVVGLGGSEKNVGVPAAQAAEGIEAYRGRREGRWGIFGRGGRRRATAGSGGDDEGLLEGLAHKHGRRHVGEAGGRVDLGRRFLVGHRVKLLFAPTCRGVHRGEVGWRWVVRELRFAAIIIVRGKGFYAA